MKQTIATLLWGIALSIPILSPAQIRYNGVGIGIGCDAPTDKSIRISDTPGLILTDSKATLRIHNLPGSMPSISGSGNGIIFYDPSSATYNRIVCKSVRTLSDRSAKTDITPLDAGLAEICTVASPTHANSSRRAAPASTDRAAAIREQFPDLVIEDEEGNLLVNYFELIPVLVNAVNELSETVRRQEEEIRSLQSSSK